MASHRNRTFIQQLTSLRLLVGFLGEKKQRGWWDCGFLNTTGIRFLEATFPRTARSAALRSSNDAARLVHDTATGKFAAFHLFRLPMELEDRIDLALGNFDLTQALTSLDSTDRALSQLAAFSEAPLQAPPGPVQIGLETKILSANAISELAAHYHSAFSAGVQCFPYFAAGK